MKRIQIGDKSNQEQQVPTLNGLQRPSNRLFERPSWGCELNLGLGSDNARIMQNMGGQSLSQFEVPQVSQGFS